MQTRVRSIDLDLHEEAAGVNMIILIVEVEETRVKTLTRKCCHPGGI